MSIWLVRAGRYGEREKRALDHGIVGIGWEELPNLSKIKSETLFSDISCTSVKTLKSPEKLVSEVPETRFWPLKPACWVNFLVITFSSCSQSLFHQVSVSHRIWC